MKYVLFYEAAEDFRSKVPAHFEAHRALWGEFSATGDLLMIGPFMDAPAGGAMAIFRSRDAAERFAKADPFVTHGIVARFTVREWNEALVP
ncbi:MAG: YciI family protein [Polyangiaceae bacterium]